MLLGKTPPVVRDLLQLGADPMSVRAARLFVVDRLQEWHFDDLVDSGALLTSELATNAVLHAEDGFTVQIERIDSGVRVEVTDPSAQEPAAPEPDPAVLSGEEGGVLDLRTADPNLFTGLGMVDAIAHRWGSDPRPGGGTTIWFELVAGRSAGARVWLADLRELRSPSDVSRFAVPGEGKDPWGDRAQETDDMARRYADEDERVVEERYVEERRGGAGRWILALLVVIALAIGGFFLLGGEADVDTEGDLEIPEVDVDVNAPDVDVDSEEAPPASAEAG